MSDKIRLFGQGQPVSGVCRRKFRVDGYGALRMRSAASVTEAGRAYRERRAVEVAPAPQT